MKKLDFKKIDAYVLIYLLLILIGSFFNKWTESSVVLLGVLVYRSFYQKRSSSLSLSYSILIINLLVGYLIGESYIFLVASCSILTAVICQLCKTTHSLEEKLLSIDKQESQQKSFDVDNCTKDELIARCKELKFNEDKINLCVEMFIDKSPYSKLAEKYCIEPASIGISKMRLKKKLNKN